MRKRFSERHGHKQIRDSFQIESIDDALKNRLWNVVKKSYLDILGNDYGRIALGSKTVFLKKIYDEFFKSHKEVDSVLTYAIDDIKKRFFSFNWFDIYDFLEYLPSTFYDKSYNESFRKIVNEVLEAEMSGYRFIDEYISPIINEIEINSIEEALSSKFHGVNQHFSKALEHLSDRENPDYINSIKESISAVESILNSLAGTTNVALNRAFNKFPIDVDPTLKEAFIKLYSWTSSSDGIRHAITENEIRSSFEEAKFMLVSCSAFVNYAIAKSDLQNTGVR